MVLGAFSASAQLPRLEIIVREFVVSYRCCICKVYSGVMNDTHEMVAVKEVLVSKYKRRFRFV
jgi:hypothetical protein